MAPANPTHVGETVRAHRSRRGVSLAQLASAAGVSKAAVVALEAGRGNPTLSTLAGIADALGISVSDLLESRDPPTILVVDPATIEPLWHDDAGSWARLLFTTAGPARAEVWSWTLTAGVNYASQPHSDGISESIVVTAGTLRLTVGEQTVDVGAGCAVTFGAGEFHAYESTDHDVSFMMTVHLRPL